MFQYSEQNLKDALRDIKENGIKVREASRKYMVPKTTIFDRISGRKPEYLKKPGPRPILTTEGEKRIKDWVISLAKCGFPINKNMLLETVSKIAKESKEDLFKNGTPGQTWYLGFLRRNPEISLREAESINKARAVVSENTIRKWFSELQQFLNENDLMDIFRDPRGIFSMATNRVFVCVQNRERF